MNETCEKLIHTILDLFLPQKCAGCGSPGEIFCEACQVAVFKAGGQCLICGFRNGTGRFCQPCRKSSASDAERVLWAGRYDGALKNAIWKLKYKNQKTLAKPLGKMLFKKFSEIFPDFKNQDFAAIPIPLSKNKKLARGFNQAELLAREFSGLSDIQLLTNSLLKVKETPAQVNLENKELRIKNLDGAFAVNPKLGASNLQLLTSNILILIDDVSTTGATLIHASDALTKAGAKEIIGLVVAHG